MQTERPSSTSDLINEKTFGCKFLLCSKIRIDHDVQQVLNYTEHQHIELTIH